MERRDIDRWITDAIRATESRNKCLYDSVDPVEVVDLNVTKRQLSEISDAIGIKPIAALRDSESSPFTKVIAYSCARFWCSSSEVKW